MKRSRTFTLITCLVVVGSSLFADSWEKGRDAFNFNKPQEAAILLELALGENPENVNAYLYLAVAYEQLGKYDKAVFTLQSAYEKGLGEAHVLRYNIANNYMRMGNSDQAIEAYTLSLADKSDYGLSYFNRANAYIRQMKLAEAKADYLSFIATSPQHSRVPDARKMLAAIDEEVLALEQAKALAEQRRIEEEKRKQTAEEQKLAEEEKKRLAQLSAAEEEARRKRLLSTVFENLELAQDEQLNLGGGSESVNSEEDQYKRED